ncbi:MAG TPA: alpha-amylase/4-alpha-glucanotransferase domain-containing protein [Terriglobales bacterium]|nr:alpha-amylase/4-alpha-glucanotransferase domain-containing protein [Terriglobales bacterium]
MAISLALVLHAHQPAGNFDAVIEENYQRSYRPMVEAAARRPWLRLNLHYTGYLLDWLARHHPEYVDRVRELAARGQVEILGGGYYEPILAVIPPTHQRLQLDRLGERVLAHFEHVPRGAWLAERVWEPEIPAALAGAGLAYTILDDTHFELAGIPAADLHGYWITESQGERLAVVPSNFFLRQAIPFKPEQECFDYLREASEVRGAELLTMGDDLEKFGSWPHTFAHVYEQGWLERFFDGLEARAHAITTVRLGDYIAAHPPRGLVYIPSASYPEMMQWAGSHTWRGFLTRYGEANHLHKSVWDLHQRVEAAAAAQPGRPECAQARDHLLAAECNDVYWHGWFGGLYSPHLRNLAYTHLLAADAALEAAAPAPPVRSVDLHADGRALIELRSAELRLWLAPHDGGCLEEIDARKANANLINSIQRRVEPYHESLRRPEAHNPAHLPGETHADPALEWDRLPRYDRYPCAAGRVYACEAGKSWEDYQLLQLGEDRELAGGSYTVIEAAPGRVRLRRPGADKTVTLDGPELGIEVGFDHAPGLGLIEMVLNLLAPDAPDRYWEQDAKRRPLHWAGELAPAPLELWDGWRRVRIRLEAPGARAWWVHPIYSVSQAETGFERIYQGSAVAAVLAPGRKRAGLQLKIFL